MPTFDSAEIIETMLRNNGIYGDDETCCSIWRYTNAWGAKTFYVLYRSGDLVPSQFVSDPVLLWSAAAGLFPEGKAFLASLPKRT